jgi:tetratricopeptide (TPR) repeat protein
MTRHPGQSTLLLLAVVLAATSITLSCAKDPDVAKREFVASGDAFMAANKLPEAIIEYRNAVQQDPGFAEARRKLGDAYQRVGDRANALAEIVRAADLLPADLDLQVRAGRMLLVAGQYDAARGRADKALAQHPTHVDLLVLRANALAGLDELDSAVAQVEAALAADPTRAVAYTTLGAVQLVRGAPAEAERAFLKAVEVAPQSVQARLALANFYIAVGHAPNAEREIKHALALDPVHLGASRALAYLYVGSGRGDLAEPYLRTVAEKTPGPDGTLALAAYYASRKRTDDARKILQALVTAGGAGATAARLQLATLAFGAGKPADATALIDEVLTREPSNTRALTARAELLASSGKLDEALATAQRASESDGRSALAQYALGKVRQLRREDTDALGAFNEALRLNPRLTPAKIDAARLLLSRGQLDDAESRARGALADLPTSKEVQLLLARILVARGSLADASPLLRDLGRTSPASPDVQVAIGQFELRRGNRSAARAAFERALSAQPVHLEAVRQLVALDLGDRRLPAVRARVDALLATQPNNTEIALLAASAMAAAGDIPRAEQLALALVERHPDVLDAYVTLGRIYLAAGRLDRATTQYQALAERQPRSVSVHTVVGMLLQMQGKTADARARFEHVLQLDRSAVVAANNLAWIYAEDGSNIDLALTLAQTAKAKLPDQPEINDTLGWIYIKKGLGTLAVPPLEQAVARDPGNPGYLHHLGAAYALAGATDKARATLTRALALDGTSADASRSREYLRKLPE